MKWMGTARWTYNRCLESLKNGECTLSEASLRSKWLNSDADVFTRDDSFKWVLEVPYDIRDEAMRDLIKAYESNFAKGGTFDIKPRKKKDSTQVINILYKHYNEPKPKNGKKKKKGERVYAFLAKMNSAESLPKALKYDSRMIRTRLGEYYLCIPKPLERRGDNQSPKFRKEEEKRGAGVVSLDPGVRTFQTCFDPSGVVMHWGQGDYSRIGRLCHFYDKLQSEWSQEGVRHRRRYRLKRAARRIQKKIRNLVDDLHKKLVKYLCTHYRVILLPEFNTQQMVKRRRCRRIRSKTARAMMTWSHYRFKKRLMDKAREYPWCRVIVCTEEYTSKTCTHCGSIHEKLGGSKVFKCPKCNVELDRDANGARNILLKFLTEIGAFLF
jgi:putative transposase